MSTADGPETTRTAVLLQPGTIQVQERPRPQPGPDEVLIQVTSVGVCGSDTHYYTHGRIGSYAVTAPLVLGHESAGVIVGVGEGVDPARAGQRVSIEPGVPCRQCEQCLSGRYNLCPDMVFHATPPVDGSLSEVIVHHHAFAHAVPDEVGDDAAAMVEPLSVALWACRKAAVGPGDRVLVTGAGPVGLLCAQVARVAGAAEVVVVDVNPHRLAVAAAHGATDTVDAREVSLDEWHGGRPAPHVLLECSGHPGSTLAGLQSLAPAGRAVLVGMGGDTLDLPLSLVQERELLVTGVFRYANTWPTAIALVANGQVRLDDLVTGHFRLDQTAEALTAAMDDPRAIKSMIHPHN
ncbi:NAD(P)-dependent alcohol dehydrogenase [Ornithinimicrobium pratense]|uniref:NAD(P)-dependent alcohol dehydrogenase n=1 Tax=Ornithinimicrobium pratense TaxID=2593973 RepID=A0A5J6V630_9MICO|nr:NAD(P)-dependent alcohol dehydrogenase [Ornithinimicrobium pratense]QFG69228.1 NAD(P)-dependent alcohol dehydrogenase [Ornithinimicrobium pratense]